MLKDIPSNAIAMLTSDDKELIKLALQLIDFDETFSDLEKLREALKNKYGNKYFVYTTSVTDGFDPPDCLIENIVIMRNFINFMK